MILAHCLDCEVDYGSSLREIDEHGTCKTCGRDSTYQPDTIRALVKRGYKTATQRNEEKLKANLRKVVSFYGRKHP